MKTMASIVLNAFHVLLISYRNPLSLVTIAKLRFREVNNLSNVTQLVNRVGRQGLDPDHSDSKACAVLGETQLCRLQYNY